MGFPRLSYSKSLQLIEVAAIVSATIFAGVQLRAIRLQNATDQLQKSADFALRLNQELDTDVNEKLEDEVALVKVIERFVLAEKIVEWITVYLPPCSFRIGAAGSSRFTFRP